MAPRSFNHRRSWQLALVASFALHGAVLVSVSQTRWIVPATLPATNAVVVWLSDWQLTETRSSEDDSSVPTDVDVEAESGAEAEPEPEPIVPRESSNLPPRVDLEPSRPPIDWEVAKRRAVVYMREERAKADAYITFSYPERRQKPTRDTGIDSTTVAGIQIQPSGPCVRSAKSFLARLLMPVDVCDWGTTAQDAYLTPDQLDRFASLEFEREAPGSR